MKVEAVKKFHDIVEGVDRALGDTWDVTQERFDAINSAGYGELVKKVAATRRKRADAAKEAE